VGTWMPEGLNTIAAAYCLLKPFVIYNSVFWDVFLQ
jgi:hypothetical protein